MSITPFESNTLAYTPKDVTLPRPVSYRANLGVMEEPAKLDHVHPVFVENWHYVLDSELLEGWNNATGTIELFRFLRDPMGFVHIEGKLDAGTVAAGTILYVLPVGYRPTNDHRVPVITSTGNAMATLTIQKSGFLIIGGMPVTQNMYFSGIIFEADRNTFDSFSL